MKKILLLSLLLTAGFFTNAQLNIQYKSTLPYPGMVTSNIGGYVDSLGNEYALVGFENGLDIVDVTDPANPVSKFVVPGNPSGWREVKTWNGYAYVTTEECCDGLQIVDLRLLPASISTTTYTGDGSISTQLETIHALHIDEGFAYLYGTNLFNGAAVILDLADPLNPVYMGHTYNSGSNTDSYIHDGYVRNDTMWSGYIYAGYFAVIDVTDKANPVTITTQNTPTNFTHNTWLSGDSKTLFTTDETAFSYLASYDVTDVGNIKELDRIQSNPGSGVVVHNTHIINVSGNDYAVTSWYKDGVVITDVGKPDNMVHVGYYDTYPQGTGSGFSGNWGVYPYLPSGNLVCTDMSNGLVVLAPTYVRASYLEGVVTDSLTGALLNNVDVQILSTTAADKTKLNGEYKTGYAIAGSYDVVFSKAGYVTKTITGVPLISGIVNILDVQLTSLPTVAITGQVVNALNGQPVPNATVKFYNNQFSYDVTSDVAGNFSINPFYPETYDIYAGEWMFRTYCSTGLLINGTSGPVTVQLIPQIYDDFTFDFGWTVSGSSPNSWEKGIPIGTDLNGVICNPDFDVNSDCAEECFITDNGGGSAGNNDVDNGNTVLSSPVFDPTGMYIDPVVNYSRWFMNTGGSGNPDDAMSVGISNGSTVVVLETITESTPGLGTWVDKTYVLSSLITVTSTMQFIVEIADQNQGHIVEGGLDKFFITEGPLSVNETGSEVLQLNVSPNPSQNTFMIAYRLSAGSAGTLAVSDVSGRIISEHTLENVQGNIIIGENFRAGIYFIRLTDGSGAGKNLRLVKTK